MHVVLTSKSNNFSWISIFFIIFAQSVCTGFKAVTPLPQCMSYSIVHRKVLRMFKLPTKSLVEGYDNPSGESIFATKKEARKRVPTQTYKIILRQKISMYPPPFPNSDPPFEKYIDPPLSSSHTMMCTQLSILITINKNQSINHGDRWNGEYWWILITCLNRDVNGVYLTKV